MPASPPPGGRGPLPPPARTWGRSRSKASFSCRWCLRLYTCPRPQKKVWRHRGQRCAGAMGPRPRTRDDLPVSGHSVTPDPLGGGANPAAPAAPSGRQAPLQALLRLRESSPGLPVDAQTQPSSRSPDAVYLEKVAAPLYRCTERSHATGDTAGPQIARMSGRRQGPASDTATNHN